MEFQLIDDETVWNKWGAGEEELVALFAALDKAGTGRVSHEVFSSYVMQVFAERFIRSSE
jgi:Ca2+-binding EF-hand superfamily protein